MVESDWIAYKCKSGQTIFLYNKVTGVHKWPPGYNDGLSEDGIIFGEPVQVKELHSIEIQTDDYGCNNGCTSMYINTDPANQTLSPPQPGVTVDCKSEIHFGHQKESDLSNNDAQLAGCALESTDGITPLLTGLDYAPTSPQPQPSVTVDSQHDVKSRVRARKDESTFFNLHNSQDECGTVSTIDNYNDDVDVNDDDDNNDFKNKYQPKDISDSDVQPEQTQSIHANKIERMARVLEKVECSSNIIQVDVANSIDNDRNLTKDKLPITEEVLDKETSKTMKCSFCFKIFQCKSKLLLHVKRHVPKAKIFQCSTCMREFSTKGNLTTHQRVHSTEDPFKCSYCQMGFAYKGNLKRHIDHAHSNDKQHQCTICLKKFARKDHLEDHLKTHTGERVFECSHCAKKFIQRSHLLAHFRTHSGERPFECSKCNKKFADKRNCIRHERTHLGIKAYACPLCPKEFTRKEHLNNHLIKHIEK